MKNSGDILDKQIKAHNNDEHWASSAEQGQVCYACACEAIHATKLAGIIEGLSMYAWWKDGVEYVGTCGRTLKQAIEDVRKRHGNA